MILARTEIDGKTFAVIEQIFEDNTFNRSLHQIFAEDEKQFVSIPIAPYPFDNCNEDIIRQMVGQLIRR